MYQRMAPGRCLRLSQINQLIHPNRHRMEVAP